MRTPIAFTIYVSLFSGIFATACLAEDPAASAAEWATSYQAAVEAGPNQDGEQALDLYKRSWELSHTHSQMGLSAAGLGQTYRRLGRINEAKEWLDRARPELRADPRLASKLAFTTSALADIYRVMADYPSSE